MPHPGDLNDSYIIRTIRALGAGIGDVAKLLVSVSHQLTIHRRDTALWEARALGLSAKDILAIRHAPFMGTDSIVDSDFLTQICEKQEEAQKKAIMRVATAASVIHVQPQQKAPTPAKRSLQIPKKEEPSSKRRKQIAPRKAATQPAATQQVSATPPPKHKSHR